MGHVTTGRRVVVTGIGLICGVGHNVPDTWTALLAGKSGVATITHFDTTGFACTIAAEVKGFDPLNFIEKKEIKKMGRFIHLALADRKSTRLNSSHIQKSRMPSSA